MEEKISKVLSTLISSVIIGCGLISIFNNKKVFGGLICILYAVVILMLPFIFKKIGISDKQSFKDIRLIIVALSLVIDLIIVLYILDKFKINNYDITTAIVQIIVYLNYTFILFMFKNEDKNKILMHKDLAEKNNLKVGDKIKIKSNLFDADNEKQADETVEVEIKGLFDGHNSGGVSAAQELYENTLITDVHTAAKVYGNTEDTAVYQDATFFVKGDKNLDSVIKEIEKLDINWREYNLIKSSSNYPALQQSISGIYSISNKLFAGSLIFAGVVVSLLLLLWMNARKKEIAVLLSLGISKLEIFGQFLIEMVFISIPAYVGSYFLARYTAEKLGNNILNKVTGDIAKQIARQSASSQLGGGAEAEGFNKTLSSLDINVLPKFIFYVVIFMSLVLLVSLIISSFNILRRNPKELLIDNK